MSIHLPKIHFPDPLRELLQNLSRLRSSKKNPHIPQAFKIQLKNLRSNFTRKSIRQGYLWVLYGVFTMVLLLLPSQNIYERLTTDSIGIPTVQHDSFVLPTPANYPVKTTENDVPFFSSQSILLVDVDSSVVMYEKNADQPLPPASTTKLMTALVAIEKIPLNTMLTVGNVTQDGRVMGLIPGERLSLESLLYGVLVHSANDAAEAVAYAYPGGYEAFIADMNTKAKELHMKNTIFKNPTGLHHPEHVMSARDLLTLSMVAIKNPTISKIASTRTITVSDETYTYFHDLVNVNELLGVYPGIAGLKTGYTPESGESLVTLYRQPNIRILSVLLGSGDRFGETITLLSWATSSFSWQTPYFTP